MRIHRLVALAALASVCAVAAAEPVSPPSPGRAPFVIAGESIPDSRVRPIPVLEGHAWALPALLEGLAQDDPQARARCCFLLGQIADPTALEPLADALGDEDRRVREFAGMALARMGDRRGNHPAAAALQGNRWWIRFWAVETLGCRDLVPDTALRDPDQLAALLAQEGKERRWPPARAQVEYSGPADASLGDVIHEAVNYLIGETDWWWHCGDYPQVLRGIETATWLDPTWAEGFGQAGYLYWSLGRDTEAIAAYRKGVRLNPDDWSAHFELGFYYFNAQKRYEHAIPRFARARELGCPPEPARMHAHALEDAGRPREALAVWRELAAAYPDDLVVKANLRRFEEPPESDRSQ